MQATQTQPPASGGSESAEPAEPLPDIGPAWESAMRRGDWEAAWRETDRIELPRRARQARPGLQPLPQHLRWEGTPLAGRRVLVCCEHGLGDTLQFIRFIPQLGAAQVHLMVQPPLVRLLQGTAGLGEVHDYWAARHMPDHDVDVEVMELAYALRTKPSMLPPPSPIGAQLRAEPLLPPRQAGEARIGLLWAASEWDPSRSVSLDALRPLLAIEGASFFSLQQGPAAQDLAAAASPIHNLAPRTVEIADAAAAMRELDLVITVDGMPAHLAGSLGRPTWLLLKHDADWRWMQGSTSPWYPAMRLFRQPAAGDWQGVVAEVSLALRGLLAGQKRG